jgi:hypothetical protein
MLWSKLKTRFRALICDELRDRLDFHLTSYRESHDGAGEIWITLDGEKIYSCGHYKFEYAEREGYYAGLAGEELRVWLAEKEIHSPGSFGTAMKDYLDMNSKDALASQDPFIRAFAIIDRRTGKRALDRLALRENEHSLVKMFYRLRIEASGGSKGI